MNLVRRKIIFVILTILWITSCGQETGLQRINEKGFLILIGLENWVFYPANSLDSNSCQGDLSTENLKKGISVLSDELVDTTYSKLIRSMDTLDLMYDIESIHGKVDYLLVCAVEIEYKIDKKFVGVDSQLKSNFSVQTRDKKIEFVYNQFPVSISDISPIFCLDKRKANIFPIECENNQDPDGYLDKICEYIRSKNKYSELIRKYKIKKISIDTLDNKRVIKVELTCCGLGDIAYFDVKTKKIIKLNFGAL